MVILHPEQGDDYATNLKQGKDNVTCNLETFPKDVAGLVESAETHLENNYVAFKISNRVGPPAKKKKQKSTPKASNRKTWHKRELSTYPSRHSASFGNTTRTVFIGVLLGNIMKQ